MTQSTTGLVELKGCPFCGKQPVRHGASLQCDGLVDGKDIHNTISMQHSKWNNRAPDPTIAELVAALERAQQIVPQYYVSWHANTQTLLTKSRSAP